MGPTGSGKSNARVISLEFKIRNLTRLKLIDTLTPAPQSTRRASNGLCSYTRDVRAVRVLHHVEFGDRLVLVDTPGFDDTERSDMEVLRLIADWLRKT